MPVKEKKRKKNIKNFVMWFEAALKVLSRLMKDERESIGKSKKIKGFHTLN